ncbi:MAG: Crp/Fnr family transcriptional regulator [Anaerolineae bacterium]|nr:Crp/Fnr family transcriptional regulator [Promineifilum sp.]MCZ2114513.1 Crp/Fnr family transcriptional regulator [Anaerolineae bacterium]
MSDLAARLALNPVFGSLSEIEREQLAKLAIRKKYEKGEWIAPYGEKWPHLFMVGKGTVHALKESREGRSLIVMQLGAGDIFWGIGFFIEDAPMPVLLEAYSSTQLYLWPRETLVPWLQANGRTTWNLMVLMVQRMMRASDIVEELAFQPVKGRLARMLLSLYGDTANEYVPRNLTLDEMAARIGTKREMVCRLLYEFAEEGLIEIKRTEFMIADREKLEQFTLQSRG